MFNEIIEAENTLATLLPVNRLQGKLPVDLRNAAVNWSGLVWQKAVELGPMPLADDQLDKGKNLIQHPVFICGVHRSGTTLVRNLLDHHPQLVVLPSEGTYYTNLEHKLQQLSQTDWASYMANEWLRRLANPINQPPYWLLGRTTSSESPYVNFARYVLAWWQVLPHKLATQWPHLAIILAYASCTNTLGAKLWVDKTPTNERFIDRMWQEFASARIIHVVREPIATLTSRKVMEPTISLRNALRFLKTSYQIAAKQLAMNNNQYLLVKYESLCDDPEIAIKQMLAFLEIGSSESTSQSTVVGIPTKANSSFKVRETSGQIIKADQHKQNDVLSERDKRLIASGIGNDAGKLGYHLPPIRLFTRLYSRFKLLIN